MKSLILKLALVLMSGLALTGCASNSPTPEGTMRLYSPSSLHLKAGMKVETIHGTYVPQVDEIWHSHAEYMARVYEGLTPK